MTEIQVFQNQKSLGKMKVMSIVTVRNVEAKRLLLEEIPQIVQHHEGSPQVVQLQDDDCMEGCHMRCIPNNRITPCLCVC
ncbi:uncharacterized protein LOC9301482 [Arabidopsis lyrata subsp. lyrata]|uniref:uncharacterized protein LOC9301482 n=1 Tax=Arabidopsis lyrata subsp. lyrata TaxID=81972 RepID=UPI000A29BBA7|nr:uncharacterized protein LOC9301482 [Arabidopsis lyrata subsp. lyrata]|eukprot:XP_020887925.1 uncharacterized protein LOC9301482 [Arabidopsis lyrata subsp. lyrata]